MEDRIEIRSEGKQNLLVHMTVSETASERIPTNLRCLLILEVLGRSDRAMTATEINAHLNLPKQSIHRLCSTLEAEGFITRAGGSMHYHAARRLRELGAGLLGHSHQHIIRHQILETVSRKVGETVNFAVPRADGMSYIDRVETDWAFRVQLPIGSRVPFHCTASGKTFLASLPSAKRRRLVDTLDLSEQTPCTHVTPDSLLADVKRVAKLGYALDREEFITEMVAIAVPILGPNGQYIGAVSFHGPTQRMSIESAVMALPLLQKASKRLSHTLLEGDGLQTGLVSTPLQR